MAQTALVMELVEGTTLADKIAQRPIHLDEALAIARQIAEALQAAHEQGIVHRDLKPANIKVREDGSVKVLDFGLAKMLEPNGSAANLTRSPTMTSPALMTGVGVLVGTAAYMSPEQAKGRPADRRSDLWAIGCVLYEMLTGKPAFGGETLTDVIAAVLKNEPDWGALPVATPGLVRSLLRRCLQKDPNRRLQHVGDARIELEEAIAEPDVRPSADPATGPRVSIVAILPWALAAIVSVAFVAQLLLGRSGSPAPPVVRLDLNMPAGVELPTTGAPT
jgi:serine/threonine protein kinase